MAKNLDYLRIAAAPAGADGDLVVTLSGADGAQHALALGWGSLVRVSTACDRGRELASLSGDTKLVRPVVADLLLDTGLATLVAKSST